MAGTQEDSWSGYRLSLACLAAKPSHMGADVGGLACYMHWPTNYVWHTRTSSL
jgi:hypothetical protein